MSHTADARIMMRWFSPGDWLFASLATMIALFTPAIIMHADPTPVVEATKAVSSSPHDLLDIVLRPDISLGNVLTLVGMIWWIGRWGARTMDLVNNLPHSLRRIDERLDYLERRGCNQLPEHRRVLDELGYRRKPEGEGDDEMG